MLRVLIVDDDAEALYRTQRLLRAFRRDWYMKFCFGPEPALDALALEPYDVVVADLKMPGADGGDLLACVRDLYPDAIRLLVCSQTEHTEMLRSLGPAHQYLAKPVDPILLRDAISRAGLLGKRLAKPGLKALVSQISTLPSLPGVFLQLVDELRNPEASVQRVGDLISQDVAMTAKVLQLVNSSFFGLTVHVKDVHHAAALLGLNALKPLVLSAGVFRQLETSRVPAELAEQVLEHSVAVGCLARRLADAEGLTRDQADNAMLAGILHDIGKLVLADHFGREYAAVCLAAETADIPLLDAELDQFAASHADIGGYLLGLWGLPQDLIEAVALHHDPNSHELSHFTPLTAVHAANAIVNGGDLADLASSPRMAAKLDRRYLARLQCERRLKDWQALATAMAV
ncbi:MAG: HDOD domain-containing protein [Pirellulales bacterium]|nr:HDOD domain-containing protein [Pirellulales bacterium]